MRSIGNWIGTIIAGVIIPAVLTIVALRIRKPYYESQALPVVLTTSAIFLAVYILAGYGVLISICMVLGSALLSWVYFDRASRHWEYK